MRIAIDTFLQGVKRFLKFITENWTDQSAANITDHNGEPIELINIDKS